MLSPEQMKTLKQVNVSKDPDKTKLRVKQDFSEANNAQKREIEALSAQKRHSFYRAYNTGSINARLVLAMAQALNVSPYYYTGEEDDKKPLDDKTLQSFLKDHGYDMAADKPVKAKRGRPAKAKAPAKEAAKDEAKPVAKDVAKPVAKETAKAPAKAAKTKAPSKRTKKAAEAVAPAPKKEPAAGKRVAPAAAQSFVIHLTLPDSPEIQKVVKEMTEEDAVSLLKAMLIREKTGQEAGQIAVLIKRCLLG